MIYTFTKKYVITFLLKFKKITEHIGVSVILIILVASMLDREFDPGSVEPEIIMKT